MSLVPTVKAITNVAFDEDVAAEKLRLAEQLAEAADNLIFAVRYGEPAPSWGEVLKLMHALNDKLLAYRNPRELPPCGAEPEAKEHPFFVAKSQIATEAAKNAGIPCTNLRMEEPLTDDEILGL